MYENEYLSVKEFAVLLKVHYNTVIRAIKSGKLNAFRISSKKKSAYRIARSEIHRVALFDMFDLVTKIVEAKKGEENVGRKGG